MKKRINLWPLFEYKHHDDDEVEYHVNLWVLYFIVLAIIYVVMATDG